MRYFSALALAVVLASAGCDTMKKSPTDSAPMAKASTPTTTPAGTPAAAAPAPTPAAPGGAAPAGVIKFPAMAGASHKLDAKGYIKEWLIVAPIKFGATYDQANIGKEQIPGEGMFAPKVGDKLKVKSEEGTPPAMKDIELTWQRITATDYYFDVNAALKLDGTDTYGCYVVAYLDAPEEIKGVSFGIGSNDNACIYLNGKNIHSEVTPRAIDEDQATVDNLTLNKGLNLVVYKLWNDSSNWQGAIRLHKGGQPVTNVTVKLPA